MTDLLRRRGRVFLLLILCFGLLAGCAETPPDPTDTSDVPEPPEDEKKLTLAVYTGEELDPFLSQSRTNVELLRLCYPGLVSVDDSWSPVCALAERYEWDGTTVRLYLRSDALFSDGSAVTARDCAASFQLARGKNSIFAENFQWILSYKAVGDDVFSVTFLSGGESQLNLLSIPIVKQGAKSPAGFYYGAGRYAFSEDGGALLRNPYGPFASGQEQIGLLEIRDKEALVYNFNYNRLQAVFADVSEDSAEFRSGELVSFASNRLTFLVTNCGERISPFSSPAFTCGLFCLLDRSALVSEALRGYGDPVWYPFNPAWKTTAAANLNQDISSVTDANEYFRLAGIELSGSVRMWNNEPITLDFVVNKESPSRVAAAQQIAHQLSEAGFTVLVRSLAWEEYLNAIKDGQFDLYLAEVQLPANMDPTCLFTSELCNSGRIDSDALLLLPEIEALLAEQGDLRQLVSHFREVVPFIPLYFARDALAVSMGVSGEFRACEGGLFSGIETWQLD